MLVHFERLLESIVANPDQPISELSLLTEEERHQLLVEWNDTKRPFPSDDCLHELFERQVGQTPEAVALVFEGKELTYRELNQRANQLAHRLRNVGVGPDVVVGICMERSLEMVIAVLGILKAGGAYLPLDPTYPLERLSFMLEDADVDVLLTQERLRDTLPSIPAHVFALDAEDTLAGYSEENPDPLATADNLAYVIYTSGSTGKPKGVMIEHRGIVNRIEWMQDAYGLTERDRVLQKTPFSFDVSVWEFLWPLLFGARLVIAKPKGHRDPHYLIAMIRAQQITVLHFVPSMLRSFVAELSEDDCASLRHVICSGEALPIDLQQRFLARSHSALHNLYGPTETSVDVTSWRCDPSTPLQTVPIGRPISNTQIYILDDRLEPVPVGVPGELHIGGVGLARGYLSRPDLTAERFLPDPFSGEPGARIYKTGDLARYLPDGDIEYLGRIDNQVKIRGFRIELGEIEATLNQHPEVAEVAVIARDDGAGEERLVAYLVPSGEPPSTSELRGFLKTKLPDYMVPAVFVTLESLPLTPSGKLDRRALPEPDHLRPELEQEFVAPRTERERILAEIWADVLGVEQVGIYDNFFDLGGDSIRAIQVLSAYATRGQRVALEQLFLHQTINELAEIDPDPEQHERAPTEPFGLIGESDRSLLPPDVIDAYPLSRLQAGMLFHSELAPKTPIFHTIFGFHLQARFAEDAFRAAIRSVIGRHAVLRTSFALAGYSEPLQLVHSRVEPRIEILDLRDLDEPTQQKELSAWTEHEKDRGFEWTSPSLVRFVLHLRSNRTFQFTVSFHHAILDGWSVASMLTELFQTY
jgi:amino acid adenylation domain-containing protein